MKVSGIEWLRKACREFRRNGFAVLMSAMVMLGTAVSYGAHAQTVTTTTVQGTLYLANGQAGSGTLVVSWPSFTTSGGQAVVAGSQTVTVGSDGFVSVNLMPNVGATPAGLYYTAVFYLSDGSTTTQYWVVPAAAQATLAQVESQVLPAAQAAQAVSKAYVDQAIAEATQSQLSVLGETMTGPLYLSGDPTQALQAADKHYVDVSVSQSSTQPGTAGQIAYYPGAGTALGGLSTVPLSSGGTGAATAAGALQNLGGISATSTAAQTMAGGLNVGGAVTASTVSGSVNSQINVMAAPYGAQGDCATDDSAAIQAALNVQLTTKANITVYFPAPPGGCYLTSTLTYTGASMQGQAGNGFVGEMGAGVILQGKPGEDILHVPDPTTVGSVGPRSGWQIRDITFNIDASVDVSSTLGAHRWPGKWDQTCGISASSSTLTCTKMEFSCADIGQAILVKGAGWGGTDLSTTVANVTPCWQNIQSSGQPTVTLTSAASTTVSSAYVYLAEANMPVTQRVGNCGMAFDNYDGNTADWHMTGVTDNWGPVLWNVTFSLVNSTVSYNNICGIYFGATWNPYLSDAQNLTFWNLAYGVVQGMPDTNPASAGGVGQDYQKWQHGIFLTTYPWISINDDELTFTDFQFRGAYGPEILRYNANNEPNPNGWYVRDPEEETVGFSNTMGWRIEGQGMNFQSTEICAGQNGFIETIDSRYNQTDCGGTLYMGGVNNWIDGTAGIGVVVYNYGMDNILDGNYGTTSSSMIPTTEMTQTINRGRQAFGTLTPDFIRNGTAPYYSDHDLFLWPQDFTDIYGYVFSVVPDSTSWTGFYAAVPVGGIGITNFNNMYMLGRGENNNLIVAGQNLPAGKVLVEFSYKCPSITTFNALVTANGSAMSSPVATPCGTAYRTQTISADYTANSGQSFGLSIGAGEVDIAWIGIKPVGAATVTSATIPGAPAGSFVKADGTGYGTPSAGSSSGWSTTAPNTLLVTDGASIAAGACGATTTYGTCVAGSELAHGGQNPNDVYLLSQSSWCGTGGALCTYYNDAVAGYTSAQVLADYTTGNSCCGVTVPSPHSLSPALTGSSYARSFYILNFDEVINDALASVSAATSIANLASVASAAHADGYFVVLYTNIAGTYVQGEITAAVQVQINAVNQAARDGRIYSDMIADASTWMADISDQYLYGYTVHPTGLGYQRLESNLETCMRNKGCVTNYTGPLAGTGTTLYYGYGCTGTATNSCTVGGSTNVPGNSNLVSGSAITTGSNAKGYTVNACGWYFNAANASPNNEYRCAVYTLSGTTATLVPNCAQTSDQPIGAVPGWTESAMPSGCTLAANTTYFIFKETNGTSVTSTNYDMTTNTNVYLTTWTYGNWTATVSGMTANSLSNSAYLRVTLN